MRPPPYTLYSARAKLLRAWTEPICGEMCESVENKQNVRCQRSVARTNISHSLRHSISHETEELKARIKEYLADHMHVRQQFPTSAICRTLQRQGESRPKNPAPDRNNRGFQLSLFTIASVTTSPFPFVISPQTD
ncbi:hypothetical protein PAXRUDRAFT_821578, partial [Paxillus rubicundulus Ve08.2h10]